MDEELRRLEREYYTDAEAQNAPLSGLRDRINARRIRAGLIPLPRIFPEGNEFDSYWKATTVVNEFLNLPLYGYEHQQRYKIISEVDEYLYFNPWNDRDIFINFPQLASLNFPPLARGPSQRHWRINHIYEISLKSKLRAESEPNPTKYILGQHLVFHRPTKEDVLLAHEQIMELFLTKGLADMWPFHAYAPHFWLMDTPKLRRNPDETIQQALRQWELSNLPEDQERFNQLCYRARICPGCFMNKTMNVSKDTWEWCPRCQIIICYGCDTADKCILGGELVCHRCDKMPNQSDDEAEAMFCEGCLQFNCIKHLVRCDHCGDVFCLKCVEKCNCGRVLCVWPGERPAGIIAWERSCLIQHSCPALNI